MEISVKVYQSDVDWGGILYHTNHLRFFEHARTEWFSNIGFSGHLFGNDEQLAFVIANVNVRYISPAFLNEQLTIKTQLLLVKKTSMVFKQSLWRNETCLADAETTMVLVNIRNGQAVVIPEYILESLNNK